MALRTDGLRFHELTSNQLKSYERWRVSKRVLQLYRVEWEDAYADGGWQRVDKEITPHLLTVHSVGYCVAENKKAMVLSQQLSERGNYSDTISIPKSCIVKKVKLKHQVVYES